MSLAMGLVVAAGSLLSSCQSCGDKRVEDISDVPGVYEGEAKVVVPEKLVKMVPDSLKGMVNTPLPAKIEIKKTADGSLVMELKDFETPKEMMELQPSSIAVVVQSLLNRYEQEGEAFTMAGEGEVALKDGKKFTYAHEGRIEGTAIHMDGIIYIIPKIFGIQIVFDGEKC